MIFLGWGKDIFGKTGIYQVILKKIELPVVPFAKCQANLRKTRLGRRFLLNKSFMCAGGEEGIDACQGDGGGPLVCEIDGAPGHYYQAGIVAWGREKVFFLYFYLVIFLLIGLLRNWMWN